MTVAIQTVRSPIEPRFWERSVPAIILLVAWEIVSRVTEHGVFLFGSPSSILRVAATDLRKPSMYFDIGLTTSEMLVGLLLGSALGTVLGLSLWLNARMGRLFVPYIVIGGSIPIVAVAPILIMWFGTGFVAKVVLACFSTFLVAATQAFEGAQAADAERLDFAKALRATRTQMVTKIVFPSALLWVFAGLRLNVGFALIAVFIGEFVSSEAGVGRYIMRNGGLYDIPRVLFGVGILAGLALAVNALTGYLVRLWVPAGLAAAGSNE